MALTQISTDGIKNGTITGSDLATSFATTGDFTFTGDNANILFDKDADNIRVFDGSSIDFGNSGDLKIHHTGNVNIIDDVQSKTISIQRGGVEQWKFGDGTFQAPDNKKIQLGNAQDLQIYHDGTNSYVNDTGTGVLRITSNQVQVTNAAASEVLANFIENGAVELYHNNSKKFETTSTGATVTGTLITTGDINVPSANSVVTGSVVTQNATALTAVDNGTAFFGTGLDLRIFHDGTDSYFRNETGELRVQADDFRVRNNANNQTQLYCNAGAQVELYHNNSKKFETTSAGATLTGDLTITDDLYLQDNLLMGDTDKIAMGDGEDLQIYHDGSHSYIQNTTGDLRIIDTTGMLLRSNSLGLRNGAGDENYIECAANGAVELYYDNSKKLATASDGITVYGRIAADELDMGDDEKVKLGASDDLQIYHNGSGNFIDAYTSHLQIRNENSEIMAAFNRNGTVDIYHDGGKKFASHSNGLSIKNEAGGSSTSLFLFGSEGESAEIQMNADDGDDNADYFRLIHMASDNTWRLQNYAGGGWENNIKANGNGAVELYHDNSLKLSTSGHGIIVEDDNPYIVIKDNDTASGNGVVGWIEAQNSNGNSMWKIGNTHNDQNTLFINQTQNASTLFTATISGDTWEIFGNSGHFVPCTNNTFDIGTTARRVRNIYTNDLNLSNEGGSNDVDGTWGSYTIQEGAEDLFLVNKRNGKKYKFNLTEVS